MEDDRLKFTTEIGKRSQSNSIMQDQMKFFKTKSDDILREVGELRLRNRSFEVFVFLGRSATSTLQARAIVFAFLYKIVKSSHFCIK